MALSQPVIDGWESRGECWIVKCRENHSKHGEESPWRWWVGLWFEGVALEAGKLKNSGAKWAGWKESSNAGQGGKEIWDSSEVERNLG